mgnify:CR=1
SYHPYFVWERERERFVKKNVKNVKNVEYWFFVKYYIHTYFVCVIEDHKIFFIFLFSERERERERL